jgi:hypothetical protein
MTYLDADRIRDEEFIRDRGDGAALDRMLAMWLRESLDKPCGIFDKAMLDRRIGKHVHEWLFAHNMTIRQAIVRTVYEHHRPH